MPQIKEREVVIPAAAKPAAIHPAEAECVTSFAVLGVESPISLASIICDNGASTSTDPIEPTSNYAIPFTSSVTVRQ